MPAKKARTKKMVAPTGPIDLSEEIAIEPPTDECEKRKFTTFVAVACAVGLIVIISVAATLAPNKPKPIARTEVVTGAVESYVVEKEEASGRYQLFLLMKDQHGPRAVAENEKHGWRLYCDTPPSFIIGEEYTFTYRGNKLLSCYKDE